MSFDANRPPVDGVPDAVVTQILQAMSDDGGEGPRTRSSLRREFGGRSMSIESLRMSPTSDEPPPTYNELLTSGSVGLSGAVSSGVARLAYTCPKTALHPLPYAFILGLKRQCGPRVARTPLLAVHEGPIDLAPDLWIRKPMRTQLMVIGGLWVTF